MESEAVVAQTASVMGYASTGYTSTGYADASLNVASDAGPLPLSESAAEISTSTAPAETGFPAPDGNAYGSVQESHVTTGNDAAEPSQTAGYDSAVNGTSAVGSVENGDASDGVAGDAQHYVDGSGMSS